MFSLLTGNWKTTSAGISAILSSIPGVIKCFSAGVDFTCLSLALPPLIVGIGLLFSKDHDVTGGTRANGGSAG